MSSKLSAKASAKVKKAAGQDKGKKGLGHDDLLMQEIIAMGGSKQDLELLQGIDSDSEIEEVDDNQKQIKQKSKKSSKLETDVEPELKNELTSFMKSLFGSAKMNHGKIDLAVEEEEDEEELEEEPEGESEGDHDSSEGEWETEEEEEEEDAQRDGAADDSGDDSMDDLPQELKDIHAQLGSRKRKSESATASTSSTTTKPAKKIKTGVVPAHTPAKKTEAPKHSAGPDKATKGAPKDVQKQISATLGKPAQKPVAKKTGAVKAAPASTKPKSKNESAKATPGSLKKPAVTWKLGDGWSKGFEDMLDDGDTGKGTKNTQKNKKHALSKARKGARK
ncbi:hypothetical protein BGZ54_007935 [Gamsiella multidivaricata]|nr:hypothetical protein BGZ54_007935 [Gamsiella multidivaricata]